MKIKNSKVIEIFLDKKPASHFNTNIIESHTGNLYISEDGKKLMNYTTCLAQFDAPNVLHLNDTKYSATTSKIQGMIMKELMYHLHYQIVHVNNVSRGTFELL